MPKTLTINCKLCTRPFQAKRVTAKYCGGTCRQAANRYRKKMAAETQTDLAAEIEAVNRAVLDFTQKYGILDLLEEDTGPLEEALEALNNLGNPVCANCDERPANGWENIEYCRRCEIQVFDLRCGQCDTRRPSVASDNMLCRKCENGE